VSFSYTDKGIGTHVISKVIRYPAIIKSVTAFQDGVTSQTENLAFNPHTGQVLLTRTTDGFHGVKDKVDKEIDGNIYSLTLPANWYYPQMGRKSENASYTNQLSATAGNIVSYGKDGNPLRSGKDENSNSLTWTNTPIKDVINASIQTYRNNWFADTSSTALDILSEYTGKNLTASELDALQSTLQTNWHPWTSYVYREDVLSANASVTDRGIYNGGVMNTFNFFTFWQTKPQDLPITTKWVPTNEVNYYSPHGNALQEKNALGIYSAAKFGYAFMMPVMVASNAQYATISFEDYENQQTSTFIKNNIENAHSGSKYLDFSDRENRLLTNLKVNGHLKNSGGLVKLWARTTAPISLSVKDASGNTLPDGNRISLSPIAQTGKWTLYQAILPKEIFEDPSVTLHSSFGIYLNISEGNVWVDDVRFQPRDAQATCYVYDTNTLRLITQFDDQHFGLYYQYNDEGKLVRKQIETEKGLKTIQETQYNTPQQARK
jgi:hypothetical protein